jgi:hypothetical protein
MAELVRRTAAYILGLSSCPVHYTSHVYAYSYTLYSLIKHSAKGRSDRVHLASRGAVTVITRRADEQCLGSLGEQKSDPDHNENREAVTQVTEERRGAMARIVRRAEEK